jgi:CRISPR system Cascade subunit CasE
MGDTLHLVRVPLRPGALVGVARRKHVPLDLLDEGYLAHCVMRELWQDTAPAPFLLRAHGRALEAWGYSRSPAEALVRTARLLPPGRLGELEDVGGIAGRPVPRFRAGQRVGFHLRACPVVRLASATHGHREGSEVDAFLARCFSAGDREPVDREQVYRDWIARRFDDEARAGARLESVRVAGVARERMVRRTHGGDRHSHRLERPDVRFEGVLAVSDSERFLESLARGIGRHKAFGFGALMLVPPGTSWER